jgi:nitrogen-specific signal transduction histidine kinase
MIDNFNIQVLQALPEPIIVLTTDDIIQIANREALHLLACQPENLIGKPVSVLPESQFYSERVARIEQINALVASNLPATMDTMGWSAHINGQRINFYAERLIDDTGQKLGVLIRLHNDTVEYTAESALNMLMPSLQKHISSIKGYTELLLAHLGAPLNREQREFIQKIKEETDLLTGLRKEAEKQMHLANEQ